jgi:hypothetical protein
MNVSIPKHLGDLSPLKARDTSATMSISQSYKKREIDYDWNNYQAEYCIPANQKSLRLSFCNTSSFKWTRNISFSGEYGVESQLLELSKEIEPGELYECSVPFENRQDCTFLVQFKGRDELAAIKFFSRRMESYIKFI